MTGFFGLIIPVQERDSVLVNAALLVLCSLRYTWNERFDMHIQVAAAAESLLCFIVVLHHADTFTSSLSLGKAAVFMSYKCSYVVINVHCSYDKTMKF